MLIIGIFFSIVLNAQEYEYTYSIFTNSAMSENYFFSNAKSTGGSSLKSIAGRLPVSENVFFTAGNSLQLQYSNVKGGNWTATVYRENKRGMDHFEKAGYVSFWLFNPDAESLTNDLPGINIILKDSSFSKPFQIKSIASRKWQQVLIPLTTIENFNAKYPMNIIGIAFSQQGSKTSAGITLYIDNIELLPANIDKRKVIKPSVIDATGFAKHVDIRWKKSDDKNIHYINVLRSTDGITFYPVGIQQPYINRYSDYTGETGKKYFYKIAFVNKRYEESETSETVSASTREMTDEELLTMVQEASFRYYWEGAEVISGLSKENIPGRKNMIASGASGFGIMALIAGAERKFISRKEAVQRFTTIVNFLENAATFHGAFPHFINGPTGKVETFFGKRDNGADLVETSFLIQGLLAAREYFSVDDPAETMIRSRITAIWEKVEWSWFKQHPDSKFLYWHWSPDQAWVINHNLIGWNETMITYLLAIASPTHPVPASMYYSGWANQDSTGQQYRSAWSQTKDGSMYTNGNSYFGIKLDVGVSNGGPLFFTHYSFMGYDPHLITDKYCNYFTNNQNIANINLKYCIQNPKNYKGYGADAWGLTASDGPFNYSADEPVIWQDHGKVAPTGAISSFPYTPEASMRALKNYYLKYGKFLWGEYGFKDAYDLTNNWCSGIYMGLNQAPMVVMIENYRSGLIWKLFMQNDDIKKGLEKLEKETNSIIK